MSQQSLSAISFLPVLPKEMLWQFSLKAPRGGWDSPLWPAGPGPGSGSEGAASYAWGTAVQVRRQACPLEAPCFTGVSAQLHQRQSSAQPRGGTSTPATSAQPCWLSRPSGRKERLPDVNSWLLSWAFKLKCTCFILVLMDWNPPVLQLLVLTETLEAYYSVASQVLKH